MGIRIQIENTIALHIQTGIGVGEDLEKILMKAHSQLHKFKQLVFNVSSDHHIFSSFISTNQTRKFYEAFGLQYPIDNEYANIKLSSLILENTFSQTDTVLLVN